MAETVEDQEQYRGASNLQLIILFIAVFIDLMGFGIIIPILPVLNEKLGGTSFDYGLIIAIYSLMQFIFSPIWGNISDKVGRKPVIVIGLGGSGIGFAMTAYAIDLWVIYLSRAVSGVFTAATLTTANAYIADVTPPEERAGAFSLISGAFGLGFALGPGAGGLLAAYKGIDPFLATLVPLMGTHVLPSFAAGALAVVSMFAAMVFLPESLKDKVSERVEGRSRIPILDTLRYRGTRNALLFITMFSFVAFGLSSFITAFPLYALEIDDSVDEILLGYYFTYVGILLFVVQTFFIRGLIKRLGEANLVKIGLMLVVIGFVGVSFTPSFVWTFLPNTLFTLGIAFLLPTFNSLISNTTTPENQGNIMGIAQGWSAFFRILGPIIAGLVFDFGIRIPFYLGAVIYIVLFIIALRRIKESPGKLQ